MEKKYYSYIKLLSFIGLLLAVYLFYQQINRPAFQPCYINSYINCEAVISGEVAKTFGLPTPLYGLIGYVVIFMAAVYQQKKLLLGTAIFGLIFCLWIAYKELFQLHVICPICITCQLIMITVFYFSVLVIKKK